ncbi:D-2-hydroxyacid dehydrogenase [Ligilactobacillus equi]|uniref:D-2-hydroxyacid dehydrogenase n=1 Tax=Ligilactobacillus equi TaxID=137357 RepID=UPI000411F3BB|nr:D-2-hydroxyacid dehydrogenase [Ligilactobacillus equi]MCQ2556597.1 D-2-hydroxyacid dehydrogenase [Ligilactobacillus sp.]
MKIIAYAVREDEKAAFAQWQGENPDIEVKLVSTELTVASLEEARGFDAIVAFQTGEYPADLFDRMQAMGIKDLSVRNVGVDNLNLASAKQNGITITNVPAYSPNAVAEFAVSQVLKLLRNAKVYDRKISQHDFRWAPNVAGEINGKTVGVLGTGRIGQVMIKIMQGFGAKIVAYDPFPNPDLAKQGIYLDSPDDVLKQADIVSLHVPATKDNFHLINQDTIAEMRDGAIIVNVSRGALIDTPALVTAVKNGKLAGAVLDTYENEASFFNHDLRGQTLSDPLLTEMLSMDEILLTPHIAFYTDIAVGNMVRVSLDSAKDVLTTGTAPTVVVG